MGIFSRNSFDKKKFTQTQPSEFMEHFGSYSNSLGKKATPDFDLNETQNNFQTLWAMDLPREYIDLLNQLSDSNFPKIHHWESAPIKTDIAKFDGNIVEEVLLKAQVEFPTDYVTDWFAGTVSLDPIVNKNNSYYDQNYSYLYPIYEPIKNGSSTPQIYLNSHANPDAWGNSMDLMAKDLPSFLYFLAVSHAHAQKKLSDNDFLACFEKMKTNIKLPYYYNGSMRIGRRWISSYDYSYQPPRERGATLTLDYFQRSKWITELLKGNHNNYLWNIQNSFYPKNLNPKLNAERHAMNMEHLPTHVPDALYYLFRCFFKGEPELKQYISVCKDSPSRIIKDAALLVEQFQNGRTFFGEVDNIQTLKRDMNKNMRW